MQALPKPYLFSIPFMRDEARRQHFKSWFDLGPFKGDRAKLLRKTGLTKGRITQLLDGNEPFGERAATNLARRLGLKDDYFESPPDLSGSINEPAATYGGHGTIEDAYRNGRGWFGEDGIQMLTPQEVELVGIFRHLREATREVALDALRDTRDSEKHAAEALRVRLKAEPSQDSGFGDSLGDTATKKKRR